MTEMIADGTGTGNLLRINEYNRAEVDAIMQTEETFFAEKGLAYFVGTPTLALNNINTPHLFLWIKNKNAAQNLHVWIANFTWNGGSTNFNRPLKWSWIIAPGEPSANHTATPGGNLNFTSALQAEIEAYIWDGVGDGMTYSGGVTGVQFFFDRGLTPFETHGIPILGFNDVMGIVYESSEIGEAGASLRFYYK